MPGLRMTCGRIASGKANGLEYAHAFVVEMHRARQMIGARLAPSTSVRTPQRPSRLASVAPTGPRPTITTSKSGEAD